MHHDPWHELLQLTAAVVLSGAGGIFFLLALIERLRRPAVAARYAPADQPAEVATLVTVLAATLSLAAAAVHLAAAPAHLDDLGPLGWGFVAAAAFQASWALAYGILPSRGVATFAIAGNLTILAAWLWSRTVGLPVGPLAGVAEPIATPDGAATAFELLLIAVLLARRTDLEARLAARLADARSLATMAIVPAVGIVFLAATLAVSLALGHSHAPGDDHEAAAGPAVEARR